MADELLTVKEFAAVMRIHVQTAWKWVADGRVPGVVRAGRTIRIHRATALRGLLDRPPRGGRDDEA
jgi:excisionase family DNA binding protein